MHLAEGDRKVVSQWLKQKGVYFSHIFFLNCRGRPLSVSFQGVSDQTPDLSAACCCCQSTCLFTLIHFTAMCQMDATPSGSGRGKESVAARFFSFYNKNKFSA